MTKLNVLKFPDPGLRNKATEVTQIDDNIKEIVKDMTQTMYESNGVGLSSIQVGVADDIIVIDVSEQQNEPRSFLNAKIIESEGTVTSEEGCLSFPGIRAKVKRFEKITVEYMNLDGNIQQISAENNLLSICLQHEIDHQNGITFYDHLSALKQKMLRDQVKKLKLKGEY